MFAAYLLIVLFMGLVCQWGGEVIEESMSAINYASYNFLK